MKSTDEWLGAELRAEVPPRSDGFWASLDERLMDAAAETGPVDLTASVGLAVEPRTTAMKGPHNQPGWRRVRQPAALLAAAAAAVLIVLALAVPAARNANDGRVGIGYVSQPDRAGLEALPGPVQNLDHWNAIYGVWDCTASGGEGEWLAPFQSRQDDLGIHSHGDGLISIHPFFERSAGRNATFSHFEDSMNISVRSEAIELDDGRTLAAGSECGGEPAVVHLRRWQSAPALETDPTLEPYVVTQDFGAERFYNDLEVWVIALAPLDAEIGLPPLDRFNALAEWWFAPMSVLPGVESADLAHSRLVLLDTGSDADAELTAQIGELDTSPAATQSDSSGPIRGTTYHWVSVSSSDHAGTVSLFRYEIGIESAPIDGTRMICHMVVQEVGGTASSSCGPTQRNENLTTPQVTSSGNGQRQSVLVRDAPDDASWLIVRNGNRYIAANVVGGTSVASWTEEFAPTPISLEPGLAEPISISLLDADGLLVWSSPS